MAYKRLPEKPNLEQYRHQAKDLHKQLVEGYPAAHLRLREAHPQGVLARSAKLADAQLVLAREHGFPSWPAFTAELGARQADRWETNVTCETGQISLEASGLASARSVVMFIVTGNVGSHHRGIRQIADRLRRAGHATVLADLLTEEEAVQDAIDETLCFDIDLLSKRAELILDRVAARPTLAGLPLALICAGTGGAAGVQLAASRPDAVQAIVSVAARPDLAGSALARVRAPCLFVVGGEDPVAHGFTRTMLDIFPRDVAHRLEVIRGVGTRFEEGPAAACAAELAIDWLDTHFHSAEQAA